MNIFLNRVTKHVTVPAQEGFVSAVELMVSPDFNCALIKPFSGHYGFDFRLKENGVAKIDCEAYVYKKHMEEALKVKGKIDSVDLPWIIVPIDTFSSRGNSRLLEFSFPDDYKGQSVIVYMGHIG